MQIISIDVLFPHWKEFPRLIMRTFLFLYCTTLLSFSPNSLFPQNSKVFIDSDEPMTIFEVLDLIGNQSDCSFIYQSNAFIGLPKIKLAKGKIRVNKLLELCLPANDFIITTTNENLISIRRRNFKEAQQDRSVKGTIVDEKGQPLSGVTIMIKGTSVGTASSIDGTYSLMVPIQDEVLVFSSVGYQTLEITLGNQLEIDVVLKESVTQLDGVLINAGYYEVSKSSLTGNISRVTAQEIQDQPVSNPLAAIQGRLPGVQISQSSGVPGGSYNINIRGLNSLRNDGNAPLIIVDGVPFLTDPLTDARVEGANLQSNPLASINPNDIESIEVLKDADATSIYGSRGSNGVVLITTKTSKQGMDRFQLNVYGGFSEVAHFMDLMDTQDYLEMRQEAYTNSGLPVNETSAPDLLLWDQDRYTDWQEKLLGGTAYFNNYEASYMGEANQTNFRISAAYRSEETIFSSDFKNKLYSTTGSLNHSSNNKRFNLRLAGQYSFNRNELPRSDLTFIALSLPPNAPDIYSEDGSLNWENSTWTNPLASFQEAYDARIENLNLSGRLDYKLLKDLNIVTRIGYNRMSADETQISPQSAFDPNISVNQRSHSLNKSSLQSWIVEPQLMFNRSMGNLSVEAILGGTFQHQERNALLVRGTGFTSDALLNNIRASSNLSVLNSAETEYLYKAIYGRINFNYDGRYILNVTGRRDGSSRFGPGKSYANFGAIGFAWIFSGETLFKNMNWFDYGKLRGSYGITGNDQIGDYQFLDLWRAGFYAYQNQVGLIPTRLTNDDFGWETNRKFEVGLECKLFRNSFGFEASFYHNQSSDQLIGYPLPSATGFPSIQFNFPATIENKGFELVLDYNVLSQSRLKWNSSFNITLPENKLKSYPNFETSPYANSKSLGKSLSLTRGYEYISVNPDTGLYEFRDLNGDGFVSSPGDARDLAELDPEFYGGWQNNLQYGNWALNVFFQFTKQKGPNYYSLFSLPGSRNNQPAELVDRWKAPGDVARFQQASSGFGQSNSSYSRLLSSSFNITDTSFIRLKNVSLSYSLPESLLPMTIYFQGQNLFTWTSYKGLDPETANQRGLPPLRSYSLGLKLTL